MKATAAYLIIQLGIIYWTVDGLAKSPVFVLGYFTLASIAVSFLYWPHFRYLISRKPKWMKQDNPVTEQDLEVLHHAKSLLKNDDNWDQNDDRHCLIWERKSLFCAIALAQKEVTGQYDHRSIPAQEIRFTIEAQFPGRWDKHPIMDFNNHKDTTFAEIQNVLQDTIGRLESRLSQ